MTKPLRQSFGDRNSFLPLRRAAKEARNVVKGHIVWEGKSRYLVGTPWGAYRLTLEKCLDSLDTKFPGASARIKSKIEAKKARGEKVVVVDFPGGTNAASSGADTTISTTLPTLESKDGHGRAPWNQFERTQREGGHTVFKGNALTHRAYTILKKELQDAGPVTLALVLPGAAAERHSQNPYTYRKVIRMLKLIYDTLEPYGEMYIDFAFLSETLREDDMRKMFTNCAVQASRLKNAFLITKVPLG